MVDPEAPNAARFAVSLLKSFGATGQAAALDAYIAAAEQVERELEKTEADMQHYKTHSAEAERERDELNAKLERAEDRAKYERKLSDQCCQERDLAESRQKLAESTKDAEVAKWEVAFREERMRGAEYARLAAVLRQWGDILVAACLDAKHLSIGGDYEAAAKAVAEAMRNAP